MILRILRASMSLRFLVVAVSLLAGYTAAYFCDRIIRHRPDGTVQVECGSRLSTVLFAPAIRLESMQLSRAVVDAEQRLAAALGDAKATNRKVLLTIGMEHCLPCRQLEQFLEDETDLLAKHFVVIKIDWDKELHGEKVQARYRPKDTSKGSYYPWIVVLDEEGSVIVTGDDGPKGVIGLAHGSPDDRAWFLAMLLKAAPEMSDGDLAKLDRAAAVFHERIWQKSDSRR